MSAAASPATPAERAASLRRIPSLDGLRAISIVMVIGLHSLQRYGPDFHVNIIWPVILNGSLGVYIFFVISGYLITRLLLHEQETRGTISLTGFYLKRAFRILPPLYLYVLALWLLHAAGRLALTRIDVLSALFFFHNYAVSSTSWAIEHFWSLSVEEQFYFLWPVALILCLRLPGARGRGRAAALAGLVIALSPFLRILTFRSSSPLLHNSGAFHMHADALMFGCGAALLEGRQRFERVYRGLTRLPWLPVLALAAGSYLETRYENYWNFPVGETFTGVFVTALLLWTVRHADGIAGRLLNARWVTHLGVLSYSMYLWQTLLLHEGNRSVFAGTEWLGSPPVNWLMILVLAELSYRLIERPSLALRQRVLAMWHIYGIAAPRAEAHPHRRPEIVGAGE